MRAVVFHEYGDPSVLRIEDRPKPVPRGDQVLVRVAGSSRNAADVGSRGGQMRLVHAGHLPHVPGNDVSGVAEACGSRVTAFVPGEWVYALVGLKSGAQAEYAVVVQSKLARAPHSIPLVEAAAVPLAGLTALQAGLSSHNQTLHGIFVMREAERLRDMAATIQQGRCKPLIGEVMPLEDVRRAHEHLDSGHGTGKVILRVSDG